MDSGTEVAAHPVPASLLGALAEPESRRSRHRSWLTP